MYTKKLQRYITALHRRGWTSLDTLVRAEGDGAFLLSKGGAVGEISTVASFHTGTGPEIELAAG